MSVACRIIRLECMIKMKIKLTASLLGLAACVGQAEETEALDKAEVKIVVESKDSKGNTETVSEVVELGRPGGAKVEVRRIEVHDPSGDDKNSAKRTTRVYRLAKPKAQVVEEATRSSEQTTYLGIHATPVEPGLAWHLGLPDGFYQSVQYIAPDSPAAAAGLKEHDILQKVNDQLIINFEQLHVLIRSKKAGEKVKLTVLRQGSEKQLDAKLSSRDVASAFTRGGAWECNLWIHPDSGRKKTGTELSPRSSARPAERGARAYRGGVKKTPSDPSRERGQKLYPETAGQHPR